MNTREFILQANDAGTLLEAIAATPYDQLDSVAKAISDLHNSGEIDFLASCEPSSLVEDLNCSFSALQRIFCETLPRIECTAEAAARSCKTMSARADNTSHHLIHNAFGLWARQSPAHAEDALALVHLDIDAHAQLINPVLLAGATHDVDRYVEEAFTFSDHSQSKIQLDAVWALVQIVSIDDETRLARAINRIEDLIETPDPDENTAIAVDAALLLLKRGGSDITHAVEPLLKKACRHQIPAIRRSLAYGLLTRRHLYTEAMIDASLAALQCVDKHDIHTIKMIDSVLDQWDLDKDRQRVLGFLVQLLTNGDDVPTIDVLSDFTHKLGDEKGSVLGWYVVSLLLTGDHKLCTAAADLLPFQQSRDGLDIDLTPLSLSSPWILYLARKILGYCLIKKEATAALLLSCLRAISEQDRLELEQLVLGYFLLNYPSAIECFEAAISPDDPARHSVAQLSRDLATYVNDLERTGHCQAFAPSERERQIQCYRLADYYRKVHKQAEEASILINLAHKSTILYGTASIAYIYREATSDPERKEIAMSTHEVSAEFPRMDLIDPVGLHLAIHRFCSEPPPS